MIVVVLFLCFLVFLGGLAMASLGHIQYREQIRQARRAEGYAGSDRTVRSLLGSKQPRTRQQGQR